MIEIKFRNRQFSIVTFHFLDIKFKPSLDNNIDGSLQKLFSEMINDIIDQAKVFERIIEKEQMPNYLGNLQLVVLAICYF